jgi:hypothetical protein
MSSAVSAADQLNYWQTAEGETDGSYTNASHWSLGVVPDVGHRAYFDLDASYKVTFPEGEYTNSAAIKPVVKAGKTIEIDGSNTTIVRPYDSSGLYLSETFGIYCGGAGYAFFNFEKYSAAPGPNSSSDFAISNFHYRVSSAGTNKAKAEFLSGGYNFFDPPGTTWTSTVSPYITLFGNAGSTIVDAEIVLGEETSFRFPTLRLQGNARTNRLVFAGGRHTVEKYLYVPYTQGGTAINETDAATTLVFKDGSDVSFKMGTMIGVKDAVRGLDRHWNWRLESGSSVRNAGYVTHYFGHVAYDISGEWTVSESVKFNNDSRGSARVSVHDGGVLRTTSSSTDFAMGLVSVPDAPSFFSVTNGTVLNSAKLLVGESSFKGAVVQNDTQFNIGYSQTPVRAVFEDSYVTNTSIFSPGWNGTAQVDFSNSTVRLVGGMFIGGFDVTASSVATTTVNVVGSRFDLYGDAGIIYVGYPARRYGIFNFKGGELTATRTAPISVGWYGNGEFNISGGKVTVNHLRTGATYTSGTDGSREDVIRVTGGELSVTSQMNGYGIGIAENANRSGRLVLDGGVVKCHQVWGANGASAFEANGGTLKAIQSVDYQLSGFDEAKLGERGLTFDCGSYDVTIAQSFADKDDATGRGRLILTGGTGSVRLTGDLSGLSSVEVRGGTVNILGRTVGNLVLNGGVLKVDPANPITVNGALVLDSPRLALASGMTLGTTSSVFRTSSPLGEEAMAKWAEAIAVSGLADGAACTFAQKETADGYELTVEVREARTTEIRLDSGAETRSGDYMNATADLFSIVVAKDAALTLSGNLKSGAMEKSGGGALTLLGTGSKFAPGWRLLAGRLAVGDVSALGLAGDAATGTLVDGTLEFTGAGSAVLSNRLAVAAVTPTNAVIVKVAGDVAMPAPTVSSGSFIKRGPGRLTLEVSGTETLFSGRGFTTSVGGAWPFYKAQVLPLVFDDANGTVPEDGTYGCLNVTDGELVLKGSGEGAKANIKGVVAVGVPTKDGSVQPKLTVDNLSVDFSNNAQHFVVAPGGTGDNTFVNAPEITVTNHAYVLVDTLSVNRFNNVSGLKTTFRIADHSTLRASYMMQPNRSEGSAATTEMFVAGGSKLLAGSSGVSLFRPVTMRFDASVLAKNDALDPTKIFGEVGTLSTAYVDAEFANGSEFRCSAITPAAALTADNPIRLTFDDSKWIPTVGDDFEFSFAAPEKISVVVRNRGLVLDVPAAKTWTLNHPVTGSGGIVKQGEGVLRICSGSALCSGVTRCEAGVVDLDGGTHAILAGGSGMFQNGTIADGGIALEVDDQGQTLERPTFSGITTGGRFRVSLGRTRENPISEPFRPVAVCTWSGGSEPDLSAWRLRGTGISNVRGVFYVDAGVVYVLPEKTGTAIVVK